MALPYVDSRTLNTLVSNTIDTYSGDPVNMINEGGEKLLKKLAGAGRIFKVNDAQRVEHPVMYGSEAESRSRYVGDEYTGNTATLGSDQDEVLTKTLSSIITATQNFNVPQSIIGRPAALAMTDIQALGKRLFMDIFQEEEMALLLGELTTGSTPDELGPFSGDTDFDAAVGSMSLAGLLGVGLDTAADIFGGLNVSDLAHWAPQEFTASTAAATDLQEFIDDVQNAVLRTGRFGGMERPTDIITTIDWYNKFVAALRDMHRITGDVVKNMGTEEGIPFSGVTIDWHAHLAKDAVWDVGTGTTVCHPVLLLNLNSLRLNMVHGSTGPDASGGFVQKMSDMAPHPTKNTWFSRLQYKSCYSLDNGRRSFGSINGWTF
jgi:hypothetical protein